MKVKYGIGAGLSLVLIAILVSLHQVHLSQTAETSRAPASGSSSDIGPLHCYTNPNESSFIDIQDALTDIETRKVVRIVHKDSENQHNCRTLLERSNDGLFCGSGKGGNDLLNIQTGTLIRTVGQNDTETSGSCLDDLNDSKEGMYCGRGNSGNDLADIRTGNAIRAIGHADSEGLGSCDTTLRASKDGLFCGTGHGGNDLVDLRTGNVLRTIGPGNSEDPGNCQSVLSVSKDGVFCGAGNSGNDLVDLRTGKLIRTFRSNDLEDNGNCKDTLRYSNHGLFCGGHEHNGNDLIDLQTGGLIRTTVNCQSTLDSSYSSGPAPRLVITPAYPSLLPGMQVTFTASNGTPPYSYQIRSGGGSLNGAIYQITTPTTAKIQVTDSAGLTGYTVVTAAYPPLVITPTNVTISVISTETFRITGGHGPYTSSIVSGGGRITDNIYYAPANGTAAKIKIVDSEGSFVTATIDVQSADLAPKCNALSGSVTNVNGQNICSVPIRHGALPSCPAGWITLKNGGLPYTTTASATYVTDTNGFGGRKNVTTGFHSSFEAVMPECVNVCTAHNLFKCIRTATECTTVTNIACYL